jgi:hypothetical protein
MVAYRVVRQYLLVSAQSVKVLVMRFKDAVQHLEGLGLVVEGAGGKVQSGRRRPRNPVHIVPVRVAKNGMLPPELTEMIRESRAHLNGSSKRPKPH